MTRSLLARITLLQQVTTLLAVLLFASMALGITGRVMRLERTAFVSRTAIRLAQGFPLELEDEPDTLKAAQSLVDDGRDIGVRVEVRSASGRLLASSFASTVDHDDEADPPHNTAAEPFVSIATNALGIRVTVSSSDSARQSALSALGTSLLLAALPILALSLLLGRVVGARALRPLSAMARRAEDIAVERNPRSLGARSGLTELDQLAESFDRLLVRLDEALRAERRLTADASHELRTPLTVLAGELELLIEQGNRQASNPSAGLARAATQVTAMRELVDAILVLHRSLEIGASAAVGFEVINLCDLLREAVAEVQSRYPGREQDMTLNAPDEVLVSANTALLASAVRNLIDNAFKFTRAGDAVQVSASESSGAAVIAVDDSGPGVPAGERERIFDPFFRGRLAGAPHRALGSAMAGFGLGLPILRRVARAHGGDVEVSLSRLGGACFVLRLPLHGAGSPPIA